MDLIQINIKASKRPKNEELEKRNRDLLSEYNRLRILYRTDRILEELSSKTGLSAKTINSIVSREKRKQKEGQV